MSTEFFRVFLFASLFDTNRFPLSRAYSPPLPPPQQLCRESLELLVGLISVQGFRCLRSLRERESKPCRHCCYQRGVGTICRSLSNGRRRKKEDASVATCLPRRLLHFHNIFRGTTSLSSRRTRKRGGGMVIIIIHAPLTWKRLGKEKSRHVRLW